MKTGKKLIIGFAFLFVVALSVVLLIVIQVPYTGYATYIDQEPYTADECESVPLKYVVEWGQASNQCMNQICDSHESRCTDTNWYGGCIEYSDYCVHYACTKYKQFCNLNIKNIDDTAGTWTVSASSFNQDTKQSTYIDSVEVYIQPTNTGTASWSFVFDAGDNVICRYEGINMPYKKVCDKVIAYRDVEKTKEESSTSILRSWKHGMKKLTT